MRCGGWLLCSGDVVVDWLCCCIRIVFLSNFKLEFVWYKPRNLFSVDNLLIVDPNVVRKIEFSAIASDNIKFTQVRSSTLFSTLTQATQRTYAGPYNKLYKK